MLNTYKRLTETDRWFWTNDRFANNASFIENNFLILLLVLQD